MLIFQKSFLCQIKMNNKFIFVFSLHNLPEGSQFRYDFYDFKGILSAIPNIRYACILCGNLKFPSTNWHTLLSNSEETIQIIELLDFNICQKNFRPAPATLWMSRFARTWPSLLNWMKISAKSLIVLIIYQSNCQSIVLVLPSLSKCQ